MRFVIKKFTALLLAAVMILGLAACGNSGADSAGKTAANSSKADKAAETPAPEFGYKAEFKDFELGGSYDSGYSVICMSDGGVYCQRPEKVGENIPEGVTPEYEGQYDINELRLEKVGFDGEKTALAGYVPLASEIENDGKRDYVSANSIDDGAVNAEGNLVVVERVYTSYSEAPEEIKADSKEYFDYSKDSTKLYLRVLDSTGAELSCCEVNFTDSAEYISGLSVDAEGNCYIGTDSRIYVYSASGEELCTVEASGYIYSLANARNGDVYALLYENSLIIRKVDIAAKELSGDGISPEGYAFELISGGGDYDLYYTDANGGCLYGYSVEDESFEKILNWLDCDINGYDISSLNMKDDGEMDILSYTYSSRSDDLSYELAHVERVPYESLPQKTHLSLATLNTSFSLQNAVLKFNRASDSYHIDVTDYYNLSGGTGGYEDAITKLNTEIMAGNLPDILTLSDLPYRRFAEKGILEDLYPYIDADKDLNRDDFIENVLKAYEVDGKLYAAVASFGISTLEGASSVVGDTPGWTYDDYYAALATMPEGCEGLDFGVTQDNILSVCMAIDLENYVDWSTGKCNFDSPDFKALLEFAKQFASEDELENYETSEEDSAQARIAQGKQMLQTVSVGMFYEDGSRNVFGGDSTYIGFPNAAGDCGSILMGYDIYGITSACADKDGAWQFLSMILSEDYQLNMDSFPVNKAAFDTLLEEAQEIKYERDANGNYKLDENGERIREVIGAYTDGTNTYDIYSGISKEYAEDIKALVASTTKVPDFDQSVIDIVTEEAQAYFAGQKSVDEVAKLIQSKANIYVNEQR